MTAQDVLDDVLQYLQVTTRTEPESVGPSPQPPIRVGDDFDLIVTVRNTALYVGAIPGFLGDRGEFRFANTWVYVRGTTYAEPVDAPIVGKALDDPMLAKGNDSGEARFRMRALQSIPASPLGDVPPAFLTEQIATVEVTASVDFAVHRSVTATTNIFA